MRRKPAFVSTLLAILLLGCAARKTKNEIVEPTKPQASLPVQVLPIYDGHPVEYWMEQLSSEAVGGAHNAAEKAFKAMGKAAVPHILSELRPPLVVNTTVPANERIRRAIRACIALRTDAEDAVDALTENLLSEDPDNNVCMALGAIGVRGIIPLTYGLQHDDREIQTAASFNLQFFAAHLNTEPSLYFLTNSLDSPDADIRARAAMALGVIGGDEYERFGTRPVAALMARSTDHDPTVRAWVAYALGRFTDAIEAFQTLARMKSDVDPDVRDSATSAFEQWRKERTRQGKQVPPAIFF